jgi:hypothetical protein
MSASQMRFGAVAAERPLQEVRRDRQVVAAVGRTWSEPATGERADAVTTHQPRDAATTRRPAFGAECRILGLP